MLTYGQKIGRRVAVEWMATLPMNFIPKEYKIVVFDEKIIRLTSTLKTFYKVMDEEKEELNQLMVKLVD